MSWFGFNSVNWFGTSFQSYFYNTPTETLSLETLPLPSQQNCIDAFHRFKEVSDFDDFWKRANTYDSCLSLVNALDNKEINEEFRILLDANLLYFNGSLQENKWADDFGWWGLLGVKACDFLMKLGDYNSAKSYLNLARQCWKQMEDTGLDREKDGNPVLYGVRNSTAETPKEGVKNSVVNVLFLLLSTRLYRLCLDKHFEANESYLKRAYEQWIWFSNWFEIEDAHYLKHFKDDEMAALLSERPLSNAEDSTYRDRTHPNYYSGWIWSADNMMLVSAFFDLIDLKNEIAAYAGIDPHLFELQVGVVITKLINGMHQAMIGDDGILYEFPCAASFANNANDYAGGLGIVARYLDVNKIKEFSRMDFGEAIAKTAEQIWQTRNAQNQFTAEFTTKEDNDRYVRKYQACLDVNDDCTTWNFTCDQKQQEAICQARGMDFMAAALKIGSHSCK